MQRRRKKSESRKNPSKFTNINGAQDTDLHRYTHTQTQNVHKEEEEREERRIRATLSSENGPVRKAE